MASSVCLNLLPTCMAIPVSVAEEVVVGRCVFQNFIHEEFEGEGVPDEFLDEVPEDEIMPGRLAASSRYVDESFARAMEHINGDPFSLARQVGASIREIANEFSQSTERQKIKMEAEKVEAVSITYEQFRELCKEVFYGGFSRVKVVALFFFCADVLIKCARSQTREVGIRLFKWALQFVIDQVCDWVSRHGGWENAMKNTFSTAQIAAMGAGAMAVVAVGGFLLYKYC